MERKKRPRIVKTPQFNIPIGEAIKNPDGHYSLRIKKARSQEVEVIPLEQLNKMIMKEAEEV